MKYINKFVKYSNLFCLSLIVILFVVSCGADAETDDRDNKDKAENIKSEKDAVINKEADSPFIITYTDNDYISVEIKKEFYNPETANYQLQVDFYDENNEKCLDLYIMNGKDNSQCQICYGDMGDTSKTIVSGYGDYIDLGDSFLYEIELNNPNVIIAGGDNLPISKEVFEKAVRYTYINRDDEVESLDATGIFKFEINYERVEGSERINNILYTCDLDREYLTPESDDYRVEIYEIPEIVVYRTATTVRPPGQPLRFGTDPLGDTELVSCKVIRVVEYNKSTRQVTAYSEKVEFNNEKDALCIVATNFRNENCPYIFLEQDGVDALPEDFDPMEALKVICDRLMPEYYEYLCNNINTECKMTRNENVYYRRFYNIQDGYNVESKFSDYEELDFLGTYLNGFGVEFSADRCDPSGFLELTKTYEYSLPLSEGENKYNATIYYSKPAKHQNEISVGEIPDNIVKMDYDSSYFTPASSNYMIFYIKIEEGYECNDGAALISFADDGTIIDAKYRLYKPDNMVNPMDELIESFLFCQGDVSLLYSDNSLAYFDITNCNDLRENLGDGEYGDAITKQKILDEFIDEDMLKMPCNSWSYSYGLYISER